MSKPMAFLLAILVFLVTACGGTTVSTPSTDAGQSAPTSTTEPSLSQADTPTTIAQTEASPIAVATVTATETAADVVAPTTTALVPTPAGTEVDAAAADAGYPLTYTDATGQEVVLEERPERIISLFATNNDTLFAIGAGEQIVAVDDFTTGPDEAAEKPKVGGNNFKFNVERMVGLKPDLVITSAGTEELVDKPLRDAGVKVISTPYPNSLEAVYTLMQGLGRITGHEDEAAREVARLQKSVKQVRAQVAEAPKVSVYYETDISTPGKPFTVGPGTLTDELISTAGGRNVFGKGNNPFPQVSYEAIVKADPRAILLGNVEGYVPELFFSPTTVQEVKQRKGFKTITAVRNDRVVPIYIDRLVPGPKLNQGLRDLAVAIHPQIFGER